MTTRAHDTRIEVDDRVPLIRILREFDATPDKVFRAHVEPDLVLQWLGPRDLEMSIDHYDCRTGGSYRYTHTDGEQDYRFFGSFHEVRPSSLIVQTFTFEGMPDEVALEWLELTEPEPGRTLLTGVSLTNSFEGRDAMVASGMEDGIRQGYERLDELLG